MMKKMKERFIYLLSSGVHPKLEDSKKRAIQIANCDALITMLILFIYCSISFSDGVMRLFTIQFAGLAVTMIGFFLIRNRYYDLGRYLIHFNGLVQIFVTADAYPESSGYEFYYFTSIIIPFVAFSLEEKSKSIILAFLGGMTLLVQIWVGTGHFAPIGPFQMADKLTAMGIVIIYMIAIMAVTRWQVAEAQAEIRKQQSELVHSSNLIALGEMSGGVAHEINNPLQTLTLHIESLKRKLKVFPGAFETVGEKLNVMDQTIFKMAKMVKGMKELSRDVTNDPFESFPVKLAIDDMLLVSSQRFQDKGIDVQIQGNPETFVYCHLIQLSQVIINLMNNAVDAIEDQKEKWITIHVGSTNKCVVISVTDSGKGIPDHIMEKIMRPFFTTKEPGKGTGLGLSISYNMLEKCEGRLYYDKSSTNTRFVIELPKGQK